MRVAPGEFLARLTALFDGAQEKHSVYVTTKKSDSSALLFRATDGQSAEKKKYSTVVPPTEIVAFQEEYLTLMRTHLANMLKKRDKAKERRVDKLLVASRKRIEENDGKVRIAGSKRGAGRRKRMRALHRAQRLRTQRRAAGHASS
ncbi:uncharacterized protein MJAP1_002246 [Malassezia japonica]|uniref:Signal recognition particle subunit SRP14 n=1 Tax=Malassezia japonica TaxID=223818 RepID=A0AAF0F1W3_9BASI|nr:uncharacterized protein MJAP1_002246 [Malassezia japonica]WFD39275.1 hypothetical protein MJAP1_002246 [Malassezia japonica]